MGGANAQEWPSRPTRIVVPYPPGGPPDVIARLLAQRFAEKFGQPFVVENRAGASGNIGTDFVAKSAPDGYTLSLSTSGPLANNRFLFKSMPYDPARDLAPIVLVADIPLVAVVNLKVPARNLKELADLARARPGQLNAGSSSGNGGISHLTLELFKSIAKVDLVHVPFKGAGPALTELLAGNIQVIFDPIPTSFRHVQAGTLRGLAVTTRARFSGLPDVPTAIEQDLDIESSFWSALLGPAGLPRPIVNKLNQEVNQYLDSAEGRGKLVGLGTQPIGGPPERVSSMIETDSAKWKRIIESSGARLD